MSDTISQIALTGPKLDAIGCASTRCRPFGLDAWVQRVIDRHGLKCTNRLLGRPRTRAESNKAKQ